MIYRLCNLCYNNELFKYMFKYSNFVLVMTATFYNDGENEAIGQTTNIVGQVYGRISIGN